VNGKDGADIAESGVLGVNSSQKDRNERRLPVMAMEDLRNSQNFGGFKDGAGKQCEALGIVGIVPGSSSVEGIAIEVWRIFDEIKFDVSLTGTGDHRGKAVFIIKRDGDTADDGGCVGELGLAIARKVDADLMSEGSQGSRQGANDIGQATRF